MTSGRSLSREVEGTPEVRGCKWPSLSIDAQTRKWLPDSPSNVDLRNSIRDVATVLDGPPSSRRLLIQSSDVLTAILTCPAY
jgi:hypothetical protein